MKKLYRVTFEAELVFASESEDPSELHVQIETAMHRNYDMRAALEEADVTGIRRIRSKEDLPNGYDVEMLAWGDEKRTIGEVLEAEASGAS